MKVALAGPTTSIWAVDFTLFEMAAIGRHTTKITLPPTVAAKSSGRMITASAATAAGSGSGDAKVGDVLAKAIAAAQTIVIVLVFIILNV